MVNVSAYFTKFVLQSFYKLMNFVHETLLEEK